MLPDPKTFHAELVGLRSHQPHYSYIPPTPSLITAPRYLLDMPASHGKRGGDGVQEKEHGRLPVPSCLFPTIRCAPCVPLRMQFFMYPIRQDPNCIL